MRSANMPGRNKNLHRDRWDVKIRRKKTKERENRMRKQYRYFLMDLDGTISDPKIGITKSVAHALHYYGIEVEDLDTLKKFIGPPLTSSFQDFYGFDEAASLEAVEKYREYFKDTGIFENVLYDGMEHLLKTITEQGGHIVLATSKPEVFAKRILDYFHITKYFLFAAGSTLDTSRNRKGDVIRYALEQLSIDPSDAVMIGDREHDVIGAKENGMECIGVLYGYGDREELAQAGADEIVSTVPELEMCMMELLRGESR
jgi:phosphoglycolate phosphatase